MVRYMDALTPIRAVLAEPDRLAWLRDLLDTGDFSSRQQVAREVCARCDVHDHLGRPRLSSCSAALAQLHDSGHLVLPVQKKHSARGRPRGLEAPVPAPVGVPERVDQVAGLHLCRVRDDAQHRIWNELMAREHPQGSVFHAGAQVRYLIGSDGGWLGALGFSASAYALKDRDTWIGWTDDPRPRHLIVTLSRFLIRPMVSCHNLASWALGRCLRRLADDYEHNSGYRPVLVETCVTAAQYTGVSLRAAGWTCVGLTAGRGRFAPSGAEVPRRTIWCRALQPDWRAVLGVRPVLVRPQDCAAGLDGPDWVEQELGGAPLGDRRVSRRLVTSARLMAAAPGASFPAAAQGDAAAVAGFYRMLEQPADSELTVTNILATHRQQTLSRMAGQSTVLLVQDGTDLNFATHGACQGLGLISRTRGSEGTLGQHLHSTLAVAETGVPLGVVHLACDALPLEQTGPGPEKETETEKEKKTETGTDSRLRTGRWLRALQDSAELADQVPDVQCIAVLDREGDAWAILDACRRHDALECIVRARHNRSQGARQDKLFDQIRAAPVRARLEIEVTHRSHRRAARGQKASTGRLARTAHADLRWQSVRLMENPRAEDSASLTLNMVHVQETRPPADGSEPLEWFLLTSLPVTCQAEAERIIDAYRLRWRIEDWHRVLKSGCKAEFLNLQRVERLQRAIAIKAVIAWRLLAMTLLGRETPELPAGVLFSDLEIRVLRDVARERNRPPPETLGSAMLIMAMLGGYLNRTNDPPPGHRIIWTGYTAMIHYTHAYELFMKSDPERDYPHLRPDKSCD